VAAVAVVDLEHSKTETSHPNGKQMNHTLLTLLWLRWLRSHSTDKLKFSIWSVPEGENVGKHIFVNFQASTFELITGANGSDPLANASIQWNISAISKSTIW
jgi:hypothetical protein